MAVDPPSFYKFLGSILALACGQEVIASYLTPSPALILSILNILNHIDITGRQ